MTRMKTRDYNVGTVYVSKGSGNLTGRWRQKYFYSKLQFGETRSWLCPVVFGY